ncbi:peptidylprolyl isomerase, partial [Xanthomonas perforans]|nr:peptidylprolyl isomerase [Xanthomonas perforans]
MHALRLGAWSARIADTSLLAAFMLLRTVASACLLALLLPVAANAAYRSPQQILDSSPASAWRVLDPDRTLYLELD